MHVLNVGDLMQDPLQARKYFDEEPLAELTASIKKLGVLEPILVRKGEGEKFLVVAGQRRLQATLSAGLSTIPALITDGDPAEISIVENLLREELTAIEEAEAIESLRASHSYQLSDLSGVLGKSPSTLSEILSLNRLPQPIKDECRNDHNASRGVLTEIAKATPAKGMVLYQRYKASGLTRSQARASAAKAKNGIVDAPQDLSFVDNFLKRLAALDLETLAESERVTLAAGLKGIWNEVRKKLKKLAPTQEAPQQPQR